MKSITTIILSLLAVLLLTSCDESTGKRDDPPTVDPPHTVDPITVLEDQIASERELRAKVEAKAEQEATSRESWQLVSLGLAVITIVAFFGGTAIGSRGRRHAEITT